ncbi:MAG TPA: ABC transporter permease [Gemmataceae bacterium]|nr:ABC transporter permease [Gemmataceae bacterium]
MGLPFLESLGRFTHFALRSLPATLLGVSRPREFCRQLYHIHVAALPLSLVAGLTLGVVLWLHLHRLLEQFGTGYAQLLPQALAVAVVWELAPMAAGFIVAGRTGASLGAELGSMRLTEQIDALEVLGLSPLRQLVAPRVLACMTALPLLTVEIAAVAIAGSYAAELMGGSMSLRLYWNETLRGLRLEDVMPAVLKTMVFGYLIGVTGCYFGMNASGGTEGVGRAATRSVVLSIYLVVVSNALLVWATQLVQ